MKLALGTVQFGLNYGIANQQGQITNNEARAIINHAAVRGINTLDTDIAYGDSEQRLGEIGIENWRVVSKLMAVPDGCRNMIEWVENSVKESLQRLKVKSLYGLLLHRPLQLLEQDGDKLYHALQQLKYDGLVQKIGISIYDPATLDALFKNYRFDIVQSPLNIFDRRLVDTGWLSRLAQQGTEVHVRSVFLQGLLLMIPRDRPQQFNRFSTLWNQWDGWLNDTGLTPLQACICFALMFQQISNVIIGVDNLSQLKEILQAAEAPIPHIPGELQSNDQYLINPSRWRQLV